MNILIADDHHLVLEGLTNVLETMENVKIFQAKNKNLLLYQLRSHKIDILFQDILFGDHNAREFIKEIIKEFPSLKIIIISSISDLEVVDSLFKQGIHGYLLKSDDLSEISSSIATVMNEQIYISSEIRDLTYREKRLDLKSTVVLTPREKEVLKLILKEKTTNEIGEKLDVSSKTVEKHRANLFIKFGVKNVVGLVKKAIMEGYS